MIFAWASLKILAAPQPKLLPAEAFQSSCCRTSVKGSVSYWGPDSGDEWHQAAAPLAFQWPVVSTACTCSLDKAGNFLMSFGCCSLIGTNKSNLGLLLMFVKSVVGHMQIALGGTACLSTPSRVQFGCCEFLVSYLSSKKIVENTIKTSGCSRGALLGSASWRQRGQSLQTTMRRSRSLLACTA